MLRGNRGEAAGAELGSSSAERITVNAGTVPVLPVRPFQDLLNGFPCCGR